MNNLYRLALALLLGISSAEVRSQSVSYATFHDAVIAALDASDALAPTAEAGSTIFLCTHRYIFTKPVTDGETHFVQIPMRVIEGCKLAAIVHTHPANHSRFSGVDVNTSCDYNTIGVMRPKGGRAVLFDCRAMSPKRVQKYLLAGFADGAPL